MFVCVQGGDDLDRSYAVRCEVSVVRGVEDFCFPTHCSRGERRQLLMLARRGTACLCFSCSVLVLTGFGSFLLIKPMNTAKWKESLESRNLQRGNFVCLHEGQVCEGLTRCERGGLRSVSCKH